MDHGAFDIKEIIGDWPVYPGHPLVLATAIMAFFPDYQTATKPSNQGASAALGDNRIPGDGDHVNAALGCLKIGSEGGSVDQMIEFANSYWIEWEAGGYKQNIQAGFEQGAKIEAMFRDLARIWPFATEQQAVSETPKRMAVDVDRNDAIFNAVIQGSAVADLAVELGLVPTTVRRIFLRECLKRSPDGYASGVKACNSRDPSIAWIKENADRFKTSPGWIQQEEVETLRAIRLLESRGYQVSGERPFSRATPLTNFAVLTPRQREYLTRNGIVTLADAGKLNEAELERVSDSRRQFDIITQLLDLTQ